MPGRLEQFDDFKEKSQYHVTQKKPIVTYKNEQDKKEKQENVKKTLQANNINLVFQESKKHHLICIIILKGKGYRMVVIPEKKLYHRNPRLYLEVIDVKSLTRKTFRKDRIAKAKLTQKKFKLNTNMIKFK